MENNILSGSTPPPFPKPQIRVSFSPLNLPLQTLLIFLIFTLTISETASISPDFSEIPYSQYCNDFPPESPLTNPILQTDHNFLKLTNAIFTKTPNFNSENPQTVTFSTRDVYKTESDEILKLSGGLSLRGEDIGGYFRNFTRRRLRLVNVRQPRIPTARNAASFRLYGFWSSVSGKLCMVGSGVNSLRSVNVIFKLNYPNNSTLDTSLINGTLQSLDSTTYFKPISILGISKMWYNYSYIDREIENGGFRVYDNMENVSLSLPEVRMGCLMIRSASRFELEYGHDCDSVDCNFLSRSGEIFPQFMSLSEMECLESGKVRYLLVFSNSSYNGFHLPFHPANTLVAEGAWDEKKKRLSMVACQMLDKKFSSNKGFVGDCGIRLSLSFPSTLTLRNRSHIVGKMWSKINNGSSQFGTVDFRSPGNINSKIEGLKYEYTEIENVSKFCTKKLNGKGNKGMYPSGDSTDMRFDMTVRNSKGQRAWGYSSPLSVGNQFYTHFATFARETESSSQMNQTVSSELNISYVMSFTTSTAFEFGGKIPSSKAVEISAEGMYNARTGTICMIGCRHKPYEEKSQKNKSLDCEILVNIQHSPIKDGGHVQGTIESIRSKSDPLYFDRLEFSSSSISRVQARESLWRMDLEITMVLISNTLACIFVGLQLFYVKKNPEVLPFISVMMLIVLTLAHMIPLLLNFEAMFLANRKQNVFLGTDGWLEVNEVLVRMITMIAFLLQFRLLQLAYSARNSDESQKSLWVSDKKVLYLSLPLYIGGGLIAWFAHLWRNSHLRSHHFGYPHVSLWGELKSYVGLVLDAFLIPQIMFNLFFNSRERALAPSFYLGTTVVRLLPHAYDLYRAHSSSWFFNKLYANPRMDYYSTTWDVVICCGGLLCVLLIFVQQRYGGRCFLPKKFRGGNMYEKVPVVST